MRHISPATLIVAAADGAHAQQWCGYVDRPNSIIRCGYSSAEACENPIGKGAAMAGLSHLITRQ
jgi:hypothetical protein